MPRSARFSQGMPDRHGVRVCGGVATATGAPFQRVDIAQPKAATVRRVVRTEQANVPSLVPPCSSMRPSDERVPVFHPQIMVAPCASVL